MANQLVGRQNMQIVSNLLKDPTFDFYCLIDGPEHVRHLGSFFSSRGQTVKTLIEVGPEGARAGIRNLDQLGPIVEEVDRFKGAVWIVGVELFEGIFKEEPPVRPFIQKAIDAARELVVLSGVQGSHVMVSGAGSTWFDVVAEMCSTAEVGLPIDLVLRPGCYITHDCGSYVEPQRRMTEQNPVVQSLGQGLLPSLQVWAYVQSLPAPGLAIVGVGKRDASFDSGLPAPSLRFRPGDERPEPTPAGWEVTKIMDQHAFLSISAEDDVRIGDMIGFDISHPCTTFDKWKYLAVIDPDYTVVDLVKTFF
jgi:D-serine dehydratase